MTVFPTSDQSSRRIEALDGLRAVAVIAVLAFHDDRLRGGFLGVDLFFVISGFVVTRLLYDRLADREPRALRAFWAQRLRRLTPAVLLVIAVVLVVFRFTGDPADWIPARRDAPWAQFYGANWHHIWMGTDYWDRFATPSPFEHLWSLAIEEQFYAFWPLVILVLVRWRGAKPAIVSAVGAVGSGVAMWILAGTSSPTRVYMGTDTRAFSLLIGAVLATPVVLAAIGDFVDRHRRSTAIWSGALFAGLVLMWVMVDGEDSWLFRGEMHAHALVSGLLIMTLLRPDHRLARVLSRRPLTYVGRLSYSLYLWHWPVDVFLSPDRLAVNSWVLTVIRLAVTSALSVATYHLIEHPLRFRARWTHGRLGLVAFAVAMVATSILWLSIEVPRTTNAVDADAIASFVTSSTTSVPAAPAAVRPTWTDLDLTTAYYFGDSIASDVWPAVGAAFTAAGVAIESGAFGGVGLVSNRENTNPLSVLSERLDALDPDVLIVQLSVWDAKEPAAAQVDALTQLGAMALARDIRVVLVSFPSLAPNRSTPGQSLYEMRAKDFAEQSHGRVVYLDQEPALGPTFTFDVDGDGIPERKRDGIHVCPTGALLVSRWLVHELESIVPTFHAAPIETWAYGTWRTDERYDSPPGACAAL